MYPALLQMRPNDPMFWIMVVIALSFIVIAIAMIAIAVYVNRAVKSAARLEQNGGENLHQTTLCLRVGIAEIDGRPGETVPVGECALAIV